MTVQNFKTQKGFTLIELLVVIGILAILLAITLIAINPARQFGLSNDTKRRSDANAILNAIGQYEASNAGNLPGEVSGSGTDTTPKEINSTNYPNLCSAIMPTYISAIPVDPSITSFTSPNSTAGITNCAATPWDTGYQVSKDSNNRITVWANNAYSGTGTISVTR